MSLPRLFRPSYPYTLLAGLLLLFFIVPIVLKMHNRSREAFPALLLPAGGSVAWNDPLRYDGVRLQVFAVELRSDSLAPVDHRDLIAPIPGRYFYPLYHRGSFSAAYLSQHAEFERLLSKNLAAAEFNSRFFWIAEQQISTVMKEELTLAPDTTNMLRVDLR